MSKNYTWRIKRNYYNLIVSGKKTLEVRIGYPDIKRVKKGDTITFNDYSNIKFEVVRVTHYMDFTEMLDKEDSSKAVPGVTKCKALEMYQAIYPEKKEALGVYVFELRRQSNDMKFYHFSSLTSDHIRFMSLAMASYTVTDFICKDYPNYFRWYWAKEIPRIFDCTGEIITCIIDRDVAGVIFLKKDSQERKICTFYVTEMYRGKHIGTMLLELAFKYLGTTKPLITISDYKVPQFEGIIKKYNWELTQIMNKGYYTSTSCECVYNGKIPK